MVGMALAHHGSFAAPAPVVAFTAREGLSRIFDLDVLVLADDPDLDLDALVTGALLLDVQPPVGEPFCLHGIVSEAEYLRPIEQHHLLRLRARPHLASMAYRVRSRIFQDRSGVEVAKEVLKGAGVDGAAVAWSVATYPKREYITQWKESELAFVLRLLEDAGVFFWFEHGPDGHLLRLADDHAAHAPIEGASELRCVDEAHDEAGAEWVTDLVLRLRPSVETYELREWTPLATERPIVSRVEAGPGKAFEWYQYPSGATTPSALRRAAQDRLSAARAGRDLLGGVGNSPRLAAGRTFDLVDAVPAELCRSWLVTELVRRFEDPSLMPGGARAASYRASFRAIPGDVEYRPPRTTPRPRIFGKESAVVTGPAGEEIHVDRLGRVKVHFYWDREGKVDDHATCWLRVQQQNTASSMILPRVGWEVDVGFLDGDPDRPVVLQKLYNLETMPPYPLPDCLTHSSLQSSSSPGGGGTNEVRMNDSAGEMEFFVHAQRDLAITAGHDLTERVGRNAKLQVTADASAAVTGHEQVKVGASRSTSVGGSRRQETLGDRTTKVGATDELGVGGLCSLTVKGNQTEQVGAVRTVLVARAIDTVNGGLEVRVGGALAWTAAMSMVEAVAGSKTEMVGGAKVELIAKAKAEQVGGSKTLTAGLVKTDAGKDLTVSSESALAITTGGPMVIKCDGDFAVSGKAVTVIAGSATLEAGGKARLTPGSIALEGSSVGGKAGDVEVKGTTDYV
jgi:type VI secretion system secreted protein VgrG